jgi:hypothetical protein
MFGYPPKANLYVHCRLSKLTPYYRAINLK